MQRRKCGLHADRGFFRIDADRKIIQRHPDHVVADLARVVGIVRQRLVVRDQNVDLIEFSGILQFHTAFQRADVVTEMQPPRRAIAGQNDVFVGIHMQSVFLIPGSP